MTCDPRTELQTFVDLTIAPAVGPEVIAGSTRLKAGTATKLVLNMLTTAAMVRIGKTYGNLMVDLHTSSEKARDRARRIISMVTGLDNDQADKLLQKARWNVKAAIVMQKTKGGYTQAMARLRKAHDSVREAIGEDIEPRLRELLHLDPVRGPFVVSGLRRTVTRFIPAVLALAGASLLAQPSAPEVRAMWVQRGEPHIARQRCSSVVETARDAGFNTLDRAGPRPRRRVLRTAGTSRARRRCRQQPASFDPLALMLASARIARV